MKLKEAMQGYDYDLPLMDALNDPRLSVSRRLLAGAAIGEGLDTAWFATAELVEAFAALDTDTRAKQRHGEGFLMLEEILPARNPFQMRVWYLVHEMGLQQAMVDLAWLKSLTYQRARMARVVRDEKLPLHYVPARDLVQGPTAADIMASITEKN